MTDNANLYAILQHGFGRNMDALAVETPTGAQLSFAQLDQAAGRYASALSAAGARPGDRVAVQVEKSPEALVLYLASLRGGFVYLPLNTAYPEAELDYFLGDAEPAVVVCRADSLSMLERLGRQHGVKRVFTLGSEGDGTLPAAASDADELAVVLRSEGDPAAILYTSGTTGRPKGAVLTHRNLSSNARVLHDYWGFQPGDVLLHALPMFHTHGLFVACNTSLLNGTPMLFCPRFDVAEVMRLLPRATVFMGVPTFYVRLLADPGFDAALCAGMRVFVSGSAPLLAQTFDEFRERTGHTILERYGMTECGMSTSNPLHGERRAGTVGFPLPGVSLRVVDEQGREVPPGEIGSIEFTGPHVFTGYWRNPEKTAEEFTADGFFRSGDLGSVDERGYVSISGRGKDLIITGGYNVYPKEVERCLDDEPTVLESAVIGLAHADFGEQVTAVVVPAQGEHPDEAALIESLKARLASYKVPKQVFVVDELPRNAMGKVQKNVLRERYGG
jgi:malonyl-CoA/methylmalonyl-CoA synthetase